MQSRAHESPPDLIHWSFTFLCYAIRALIVLLDIFSHIDSSALFPFIRVCYSICLMYSCLTNLSTCTLVFYFLYIKWVKIKVFMCLISLGPLFMLAQHKNNKNVDIVRLKNCFRHNRRHSVKTAQRSTDYTSGFRRFKAQIPHKTHTRYWCKVTGMTSMLSGTLRGKKSHRFFLTCVLLH